MNKIAVKQHTENSESREEENKFGPRLDENIFNTGRFEVEPELLLVGQTNPRPIQNASFPVLVNCHQSILFCFIYQIG